MAVAPPADLKPIRLVDLPDCLEAEVCTDAERERVLKEIVLHYGRIPGLIEQRDARLADYYLPVAESEIYAARADERALMAVECRSRYEDWEVMLWVGVTAVVFGLGGFVAGAVSR